MHNLKRRILETAAASLIASTVAALSAGINNPGAQISGSVTLNHCVKFGPGTGQIQDAGTLCGGSASSAALTEGDDTNVTLTLTGTPATALLQAVKITAGWSGTLAQTRGGWGADISAASGIPNFTAGVAAFQAPAALSKVDDTNVTLTLGGTPATSLLKATSLTLGWNGTLAAGRLNSNVVQAVTNDTNVTGSIAGQTLTLAWNGTLALSRLALATSNTIIGSLNGVTNSLISLPSCSNVSNFLQWVSGTGFQCGVMPVLPSRATAATFNLSSLSVVSTQGYASAGDGGGATFKKVAAATPFTDQYINVVSSPPTLAGGSAYTNGTYRGVALGGGSGLGCSGQVVVSGGAVTSITTGVPCPGYKVGDVLTPNNASMGGTGTGATWTVTALNAATGSFTDASGNLWQITVDSGNYPNVRQFGAVANWNGSDGSATNDRLAFMSGIAFAMYPFSSSAALVNGNTLIAPKGAYLICGPSTVIGGADLPLPQGVILRGAGRYGGTTLVQCSAESGANHFVNLCDVTAQFGQFGCAIEEMALMGQGAGNSNIALINSTAAQQFPLLTNVYLLPAGRACIFYDFGRGGASNVIFQHVDCEMSSTSGNSGISIGSNLGGAIVVLRDFVFGCAPSNCTATPAINFAAGSFTFVIDDLHIESFQLGINIANTGLSSLRNATFSNCATAGWTAVTLQASNPNNTFLMENVTSSCAVTVTNGHSGGGNTTGSILKQVNFAP